MGWAGNIGKSFARQVVEDKYDSYILELVVFSWTTESWITNLILPLLPILVLIIWIDMNIIIKIISSKFRITMNQTEDDYLIYDADDEAITEWLKQ
jgi:UDP-N-acetylmuramoylalanine--D-glutamate ligase